MNPGLMTMVRLNHALEHATVAILSRRVAMGTRLFGRATTNGFYIYGDVPTEEITKAAQEGLTRLQKGERELALSPFCGTNFAVAGALAGIFSLLALGSENRIRRLPHAIFAGIAAVLIAQPVGRLVQRYLTTSDNLANVSITSITRIGSGTRTLHKVETTCR